MNIILISQDSNWWVRAHNRFGVRANNGDKVAAYQAARCAPIAHYLRGEGK